MPYPEAVGRIVIAYTVDGLIHKIQAWVRNPQLVGGTWLINTRTLDENDLDWADASDGLAHAMSNILGTDASPGGATLQTRVGGVYTTRDTHVVTFPNVAGSRFVAQQTTVTYRDKLFNRFKVQVMEATKTPGRRLTTETGGDAAEDAFLIEFGASNTYGTLAPYNWIVSGWNQFLATAPLVGYVTTLNRKLRRARGVA